MDNPWKVGDQVFHRRFGEFQCRAHTITHIWPDQGHALLANGDVIPLTAETLTVPPGTAPDAIIATADQLAAAFTEWDRRYREEPERFMSEAQHLLKETPETYGQACAPYLIQILAELAVAS